MSPYKIFETQNFLKELDKSLSAFERRLLQKKITHQIYPQLRGEPHFGKNIKKLRDYEPASWRYRLGHFRLFYCIDEKKKTVIVTAFRPRKEAYR